MKKFIPTHGGYESLLSYRKTVVIYDGTLYFTKRFYSRGDRTIDQMVQAARWVNKILPKQASPQAHPRKPKSN